MSDDGATIGIWIGEDDDLLERVDERLSYGDSRSQWIKEAMELRLAVEGALARTDLELGSQRERRAFVRQAIADAARREDD